MKGSVPKALSSYIISIAVIFIIAGFALSTFTDNMIFLSAILLIVFILIVIAFYRIYIDYIEPVNQASETIEEITKGRYQSRFHATGNKTMRTLSDNINRLARDLTDYSIQEQMQSEQLSTLIDNTESGLVLLDEKGYIHLVNRKFLQLFERSEKDYIGSLYYKVLNNETLQHTVQNVFLYEKKIKASFEHNLDFDKIYLEISGAPIINESKQLKGAVLVLHDITELKKLEGMRKDFVANVSHELRTPITSIKGFSETLLESNMEDKEVHTEFLEIIYNESNRLQLLIEDLLALSKLEGENFQLILNKFSAVEFVESLMPGLNYKAEQKEIVLTTNIEDVQLKADRERMSQVIINLTANAISYTPKQGNVELTIEELDEHIAITVSDSGMGIPKKELPRIFQRFYRIDKARARDSGGTGLGLAIVKHIIEVHSGEIKVESEVNEGTKITVLLPK